MNINTIIISLSALALVSIILNVGLVWYTRQAIKRLVFVAGNMLDLRTMVNNFESHLENIYKLENYYGDETLKFLLDHAKDLSQQLGDYKDIYTLVETDDDIDEEGEYDNVETEESSQAET